MAGILTNGVPTGPFPLTGNETLNMDTNLTQGQNPASGSYFPGQIASGVSEFVSIATGQTITIPGVVNTAILNSGTVTPLAALSVELTPEYDGQEVKIVTGPVITALAISSGPNPITGGTVAVVGAPTASTANTAFVFYYKNGSWFRG
jgi:hypothetical protein